MTQIPKIPQIHQKIQAFCERITIEMERGVEELQLKYPIIAERVLQEWNDACMETQRLLEFGTDCPDWLQIEVFPIGNPYGYIDFTFEISSGRVRLNSDGYKEGFNTDYDGLLEKTIYMIHQVFTELSNISAGEYDEIIRHLSYQ